ncbi:helix-turn-helix domain-containing protein [Gluconobacter sp. P5E10]|uniref:winged helix-turn-helix transcriptional regulator n=1 Tax=Gluconobacter sp. P5E10 TaxID=2762613 RepID=UPI001C053520|nr:helix-turn-helix domain-containing protein [Gluconobacter sp. P5E10]
MLTRTLKALGRVGMVERIICATTPPQVEYALSDHGGSLAEPVRQMAQWVLAHLPVIHDNRQRYDENH